MLSWCPVFGRMLDDKMSLVVLASESLQPYTVYNWCYEHAVSFLCGCFYSPYYKCSFSH